MELRRDTFILKHSKGEDGEEQVSWYQSLKEQGHGLLWRFGYRDGLFGKVMGSKKGINIAYGEIKKTPKHKDMDMVEMKAFPGLILKLGSVADIWVSNYEEAE